MCEHFFVIHTKVIFYIYIQVSHSSLVNYRHKNNYKAMSAKAFTYESVDGLDHNYYAEMNELTTTQAKLFEQKEFFFDTGVAYTFSFVLYRLLLRKSLYLCEKSIISFKYCPTMSPVRFR